MEIKNLKNCFNEVEYPVFGYDLDMDNQARTILSEFLISVVCEIDKIYNNKKEPINLIAYGASGHMLCGAVAGLLLCNWGDIQTSM